MVGLPNLTYIWTQSHFTDLKILIFSFTVVCRVHVLIKAVTKEQNPNGKEILKCTHVLKIIIAIIVILQARLLHE